MRVPTAQGRRRGFRVRGWIIAGVILLVILLFSLRGLAGFYTDFLWFDSVGQGGTWRELLSAKVVPALVFTVVFFVIMLTSLLIADRLAPKYRSMGPEDELVERYQNFVSDYQGRIRIGVALFFALIAGVGVSSQWQEWVLFTHRVDFGIKDPQFNKDIGFYVFQLPFLRFIANWLFAGLVIVLFVTAVAHYLNGGIRFQSPFQRVTPQVKAHLSVILAVMALVKTAQYYLDRFNLDFSQRGVVTGASYTDVKAQLPALNLLIFISIVAAGLFIWNIWRRGWVLPIIAVGLWGFVSIVIGTIYPAGVQKFRVEPNEFQNEQRYIERNIASTRNAFGLASVKDQPFDYQQNLDASVVSQNAASIDNARLWDPSVIQSTYQSLQGLQTFYKINDVDVDRYTVGDATQQVVLSAREISQGELPSQSWVNQHLVYTHGYGIIASPTNVSAQDGNPDFLLSGIPVPKDAPITLNQPDLYFGEHQPGYALVNAEQREFDYSRPGRADATTRYKGKDGVKLDNPIRRAAFALRFGDINPLISGQVGGGTKVLYVRDIKDRVKKLAPFLDFDADPYPVVSGGRVTWVLDAYTTTSRYPYSQMTSGPSDSGLSHNFNYVRNSVKATVDAYDGTVKFYVIDPKDPLIRSYRKAFPDLFTDFNKMPKDLQAHLRYPEDLFRVQSDIYSRYHVTESRRFYQGSAKWLLSPDPGSGPLTAAQLQAVAPTPDSTNGRGRGGATSTGARMRPYYLYINQPGEQKPSFIILQPFVPVSAGNKQTRLVSFMTASSDPGNYGQLSAFEMPQGESVLGPVQIDNRIKSTPAVSQQLTLLNQQGSTVIQGSLQLIPVGNSLLYIRPFYVQAAGASSYPQFRFVVVAYAGQDPVLASTVNDGLAQLFGQAPSQPLPGGGTPTPPATPPAAGGNVQDLLNQAATKYQQAQDALRGGDLGTYQQLINQVGDLINRAQQAAGGGGGGASTTTTTAPARQTSAGP
ncbi:MAG TPA: UPF0182 family protein [Acidimicrobiia bacterium]|jgi:hypothetical protein